MPTEKPRFTLILDEKLLELIYVYGWNKLIYLYIHSQDISRKDTCRQHQLPFRVDKSSRWAMGLSGEICAGSIGGSGFLDNEEYRVAAALKPGQAAPLGISGPILHRLAEDLGDAAETEAACGFFSHKIIDPLSY